MAKQQDQDAPVESAAAQPTPSTTAPDSAATTTTVTAPARGIGGLALAGIIGGGVVAAALLFGGGLALGVALPDRAPFGNAQAGLPGGLPGGHPGMQEGHPGPQQQRGDGQRPDHNRNGDSREDVEGE